ncbi:MAG: hypothetical protein ACHQ1H_03510 [Nitrososphaerales archaeon]
MTIFVLGNYGGKNLLGKARELGDAWGDKVVAFTFKDSREEMEEMIHLGADEVLHSEIDDIRDIVSTVFEQVRLDSSSKVVLFPSTTFSNGIMGMLYTRGKELFSLFEDQVELVEENFVGKRFGGSQLAFQKKAVPGKVVLCSLRQSAVSPPFEDITRRGKIRSLRPNSEAGSQLTSYNEVVVKPRTDILTILIGGNVQRKTNELATGVAEKFGGYSKSYISKIEVVYGPCIAIEVGQRLRDLPEFKSDLISISKAPLPINTISDISIITSEIDAVLEKLISN